MARKARWGDLGRRLRLAVESGLCSLAPLAGVPWPDLPAEGWAMGRDSRETAVAGGRKAYSYTQPYCPGEPLSPDEERCWAELRQRLTRIV
jgi:hypothetical protein